MYVISSAPGEVALGAAGWFYGIFIALLLLILIIALFLWGKRQRDNWWATKGEVLADNIYDIKCLFCVTVHFAPFKP